MKRALRIGIFGGSFDPPHIGHLVIAELALEQLGLDRVIFVPAFVPPHKKGNHASTAGDRLRMTKLAVQGNPRFLVSDLEILRRGISYTVETLQTFRGREPAARMYLIIGEDSMMQFWKWRSPRSILSLATVAVYPRPGYTRRAEAVRRKGIIRIEGPHLTVSSTDLRRRICEKKSVRYLVPDAVRRFIARRGLYRS